MAKIKPAGEPYETLANTIIIQACEDYKTALLKAESRPEDAQAAFEVRKLEGFFRSRWFGFLTNLDGDALMQRLKADIHYCEKLQKKRRHKKKP